MSVSYKQILAVVCLEVGAERLLTWVNTYKFEELLSWEEKMALGKMLSILTGKPFDTKMPLKFCSGCEQNFYNGNNTLGVKECWHREKARVILRKKVSINQRPPWKQKAEEYPNCYQQRGYVFVKPNREN
jgi:hypothetical protein